MSRPAMRLTLLTELAIDRCCAPLVVHATDLVFTTLNPLMGSEKGQLSRGFRVDQDLAENWCPARLGSG
jgi:hypothetical protein